MEQKTKRSYDKAMRLLGPGEQARVRLSSPTAKEVFACILRTQDELQAQGESASDLGPHKAPRWSRLRSSTLAKVSKLLSPNPVPNRRLDPAQVPASPPAPSHSPLAPSTSSSSFSSSSSSSSSSSASHSTHTANGMTLDSDVSMISSSSSTRSPPASPTTTTVAVTFHLPQSTPSTASSSSSTNLETPLTISRHLSPCSLEASSSSESNPIPTPLATESCDGDFCGTEEKFESMTPLAQSFNELSSMSVQEESVYCGKAALFQLLETVFDGLLPSDTVRTHYERYIEDHHLASVVSMYNEFEVNEVIEAMLDALFDTSLELTKAVYYEKLCRELGWPAKVVRSTLHQTFDRLVIAATDDFGKLLEARSEVKTDAKKRGSRLNPFKRSNETETDADGDDGLASGVLTKEDLRTITCRVARGELRAFDLVSNPTVIRRLFS